MIGEGDVTSGETGTFIVTPDAEMAQGAPVTPSDEEVVSTNANLEGFLSFQAPDAVRREIKADVLLDGDEIEGGWRSSML